MVEIMETSFHSPPIILILIIRLQIPRLILKNKKELTYCIIIMIILIDGSRRHLIDTITNKFDGEA